MPNQRIRERFEARAFRAAPDARVLVAPAVEVLSQWVSETAIRLDFLAGRPVPADADPLTLRIAWHEALATTGGVTDPAQRRVLARRARAAERDLRHWHPDPDAAWLDGEFRTWRKAVRRTLEQRQLAAPEDWIARLASVLESGAVDRKLLPDRLNLHGFIELTALERRLLDALRAQGVAVARDAIAPCPGVVFSARVYDDPQTELRAAAIWAGEQFAHGHRHIAVVVNGLEGLTGEVRAAFDRILIPDASDRAAPGWHLPDGGTLAGQGVIADALLLLKVAFDGPRQALSFPRLSRLLLSPFIAGSDSERHARAHFELRLRKAGYYRRSLQELATALQRRPPALQAPVLARLFRDPPRAGAVADPARAFSDCLAAWGWPGPLAGGALHGRCVRRFAALLESLRAAGLGAGRDTLRWLEEACRDAPVTERGGPMSPVQVLAPEDAAGERFDAAWVANVHAENWPGRPLTNPFLPAGVAAHMPRAGAAGELAYTRGLQAAMEALAPEVVFSRARQSAAAPRLPSPLVLACCAESDLGLAAAPAVAPWPDAVQWQPTGAGYAAHAWLEVIDDHPGLPLAPATGGVIPGGAGMLRDQSACPLGAYLRHRLKAQFPPMPEPFADAAYRGELLHGALHALYRPHVDRGGLPATGRVDAAVDSALRAANAAERLSAAGYAAERERLRRLLHEWLEFDRSRCGFALEAVESERTFDYRGLALSVRIDRLDRLPDGRLLVIDYKSSQVTTGDWADARPAQPQLPLYGVLLERSGQPVGGLALAQVRAGACAMSGLVDEPDAACGPLYAIGGERRGWARRFDDWPSFQAHCAAAVTGLLDEIVGGQAENVVHRLRIAGYTGVEPLLRLAEGAAWLRAHGDTTAGAEDD